MEMKIQLIIIKRTFNGQQMQGVKNALVRTSADTNIGRTFGGKE